MRERRKIICTCVVWQIADYGLECRLLEAALWSSQRILPCD